MRLAASVLGLAAAVAALVSFLANDTQAAWPGENGQIAYSGSGIWVMDPDGSGREQLTTEPNDTQPSWSADGAKIAFSRPSAQPASDGGGGQGGVAAVWTMDANGADQQELGPGRAPAWSPDGSRIIYELNAQIHEMDADDGANDETVLADANVFFDQPAYSPDGTHLAYLRGHNEQPNFIIDLYVADADGGNPVNMTAGAANVQAFDWAPDGSAITYATLDGIEKTPFPDPDPQVIYPRIGDVQISGPAYSPDGQRIVFIRGEQAGGSGAGEAGPAGSYDYQVWTMFEDGDGAAELPGDNPATSESSPDWRPLVEPSATPVTQTELWGDNDCSGVIQTDDVLLGLMALAVPDDVSELPGCPAMGEQLQFIDIHPAGAGTIIWGDTHCTGALGSDDLLAVLLALGALEPLPVSGFCPLVGDEVVFGRG